MTNTEDQAIIAESEFDNFAEEDVAEALAHAQDSMVAAATLTKAYEQANDKYALTAVQIAAENYALKFKMPQAALEQDDESSKKPITEQQRSRIKAVIDYLYASAKRIFQFFFDFLRKQSHTARTVVKITKELIGRVDSFEGKKSPGKIKERGIIAGLHIDGIAPKRSSALFDDLVSKFNAINASSSLDELSDFLAAAKSKDEKQILAKSKQLHDSLVAGVKIFMNEVSNPSSHPAFRSSFDGRQCFSTPVMFGQNYITASVSKEISTDGRFTFKSSIARDAETPVRASEVDVLPADEIRQICRSALRLSEMIIEHAKDEDKMHSLMREASFFITASDNEYGVPALHNFSAVANNHYFAYLRYCVRVMQLLMRWCRLSVQAYEQQDKEL